MEIRFGIDIDGTVTSASSLLPFINKEFRLNLTLEDIKEYDLTKVLNVPPDIFTSWYIKVEPTIYEQSPLAEGAKEILDYWKKNHKLYFISARSSHFIQNTMDWFHKEGLTYDHIHLIGSHDKVAAAKEFQVDIFLEDKHDNAVSIHEECGIPVLLFNTPYNQNPIPEGVIRVANWYEANLWVQEWLNRKS